VLRSCDVSNGYSLFTIETLPTITHLPNNERLGEVSRRWKQLSEDKKEAYNLKAEEVSCEWSGWSLTVPRPPATHVGLFRRWAQGRRPVKKCGVGEQGEPVTEIWGRVRSGM